MARGKFNTEMTGTGGGRWTTREDAKTSSKGIRRSNGKAACDAGLDDYLDDQADEGSWDYLRAEDAPFGCYEDEDN